MMLVQPLDDLDGGALLSVAKYPTTPLLSVALRFSPTLDEVGYQLGREPGSSATKRYAKLIPEAQQRIVDRLEDILSNILKGM